MDRAQPQRRRRGGGLGALVGTAALAYSTYRLVQWYFAEDNDQKKEQESVPSDISTEAPSTPGSSVQTTDQRHSSRYIRLRAARMLRCQDEVTHALQSFVVQVRKPIDFITDVSEETRLLKSTRECQDSQDEQAPLWNAVKIKAMTRILGTSYAHAILFLVLNVQAHLLGGHMLRLQLENEDFDQTSFQATHRLVLQKTFQSFFESGLQRLLNAVQEAVATCFHNWNVHDPAYLHVTPTQLERAIDLIRQNVEHESCVMRFVLPTTELTNSEDALADSILNETWDLLESPVFLDAQKDAIHVCMQEIQRKLWNGQSSLPLASILINLRKLSKGFYLPEANEYVKALETLPSFLELCDVSFD